MPLMVSGKNSAPPADEGLHNAVCVDVFDLGEVKSTFRGETRMVHKVLLAWEINKLDRDGKPQVAYRRFTASIGSKSNLGKFLNGWRGKKFTDDELKGFDLEKLMLAPCQLQIEHFHPDDGGGPYANVVNAMPLPRDEAGKLLLPKLQPSGHYVRMQDRTDRNTPNAPPSDDDVPF